MDRLAQLLYLAPGNGIGAQIPEQIDEIGIGTVGQHAFLLAGDTQGTQGHGMDGMLCILAAAAVLYDVVLPGIRERFFALSELQVPVDSGILPSIRITSRQLSDIFFCAVAELLTGLIGSMEGVFH